MIIIISYNDCDNDDDDNNVEGIDVVKKKTKRKRALTRSSPT